jgi:biotin carboxyl carrier protein
VTETDWLSSTDPRLMLSFLRDRGVSDRKFRLYACAVARQVAHDQLDTTLLRAVMQVEQGTDAGTLESDLDGATEYRVELLGTYYDRPHPYATRFITGGSIVAPDTVVGIVTAMMINNELHGERHGIVVDAPLRREDFVDFGAVMYRYLPLSPAEHARYRPAAAVPLLHDIFGDPFRPVPFDPSWRTEAVVSLSRGIYEERAFERMPVLADALEDAGASDEDVLSHCRGPGPHYKGCWVVDMVLGKD